MDPRLPQPETQVSYDQIFGLAKRFTAAAAAAEQDGNMKAAQELREAAHQQWLQGTQRLSKITGLTDPTSGMTPSQLLAAGAGQGVANVGRHAGNLVGAVSDQSLAEAAGHDAPLFNTQEGVMGAIIGQIAATGLPMGGIEAGVARFAPKAAGALRGMPILRGAIEGGAQGNLMTDPGQSRTLNTLTGLALGSAVPAAGKGVSLVSRGASRTPAAQTLIDAGVYPTLGQMNPGGTMSTFEQLPIVKQLLGVMKTKEGIRKDAMRAMTEAVSTPGTKITRDDATAMLDQAYQSFTPLYDKGKGFPVSAQIMRTVGNNTPLDQALAKAAKAPGATADIQKAVATWLDKNLKMRIRDAVKSGRGLQSDDLLQLRSDVRDQVRSYAQKNDSASIGYKKAYERANDELTNALHSQLPPDAIAAVALADSRYGQYKQLEDAVAKAVSHGRGDLGPTPGEVSASISGQSKGVGKGAQARGQNTDRLRELADAAAATFREDAEMRTGASVPLWIGAGALASQAGVHPIAGPLSALGLTAASALRPVRKALAGAYTPQQRLAALLSRSGNTLGPINRALIGQALGRGAVATGLPYLSEKIGEHTGPSAGDMLGDQFEDQWNTPPPSQ